MAHIGVIKYLEEINVSPSYISGTSAGGLVGGLYAGGIAADEILNYFLNIDVFSWKNYAFRKAGILEPDKFKSSLKQYFPKSEFRDLAKTFFLSVTNLESGHGEILHSGDLVQSMMASAALPFMFAPVELNGFLYADGGIVNNFPIEPLLPCCDKIIGVYVNPIEVKKRKDFKHTYSVIERSLNIVSAADSIPKFSNCNVMIVPEQLSEYSLLDLNHLREIYQIGYESAKLQKDKLLAFRDNNCS